MIFKMCNLFIHLKVLGNFHYRIHFIEIHLLLIVKHLVLMYFNLFHNYQVTSDYYRFLRYIRNRYYLKQVTNQEEKFNYCVLLVTINL